VESRLPVTSSELGHFVRGVSVTGDEAFPQPGPTAIDCPRAAATATATDRLDSEFTNPVVYRPDFRGASLARVGRWAGTRSVRPRDLVPRGRLCAPKAGCDVAKARHESLAPARVTIRLVDRTTPQQRDNSRHFFAAAVEAMRRILVHRARQRLSLKRGGDRDRVDLESVHKRRPIRTLSVC
jgi:ECF sigma factor